MQIYSVDDMVRSQGIKCLVYGRSGAGKTRLIATAPAPIIISAEGGLLSLAGQRLPQLTPIKSMLQLQEQFRWLVSSHEAKQFATVCIDSLSEIAETCLTGEKQKSKDGRKAYGEMNDVMLQQVLRAFRDLPGKNVYFTAKEEYDKDEASGLMYFRPSMPGKQLTQQVPFYFDEVFRCIIEYDAVTQTSVRKLQTGIDATSVAKDRSGRLAPFEPLNLTAIFNKING